MEGQESHARRPEEVTWIAQVRLRVSRSNRVAEGVRSHGLGRRLPLGALPRNSPTCGSITAAHVPDGGPFAWEILQRA